MAARLPVRKDHIAWPRSLQSTASLPRTSVSCCVMVPPAHRYLYKNLYKMFKYTMDTSSLLAQEARLVVSDLAASADVGSPTDETLLTIGELAEHTGLSTQLLRTWENRFGFPEPVRLTSGQRRYTGADVRLVRRV